VRGGSWVIGTRVDEWGNGYRMVRTLQPGVAVTPDGQSLALVHADEDAISVIDAERLTVERTVSFERQASLGERVRDFLTFSPVEVAAKAPSVGTVRRAAFAADGRHLYVWGHERTEGGDGQIVTRGSGLRVVDLVDGAILAEAMDDAVIFDLVPTAGGRYLYVSEVAAAGDSTATFWLCRLDPLSLSVEAERLVEGAPSILVRPAIPTGQGYLPDTAYSS
jgi:hypothetical protein